MKTGDWFDVWDNNKLWLWHWEDLLDGSGVQYNMLHVNVEGDTTTRNIQQYTIESIEVLELIVSRA